MKYYGDNRFSFLSPLLPSMCTMNNTKPNVNTNPPTLTKLLVKQAKHAFCWDIATTVGLPACFTRMTACNPFCTAPLDSAIQTVVPNFLRRSLLYLAHYPKLEGHPGELHTYDTIGRKLHWMHRANSFYTTVSFCCEYFRNRARIKRECQVKLFRANRPLELIAMDILGPLREALLGN